MTGFTVKANRSALLERCQWLAWHKVPVLDRTRDRSHGRVEIRTLKAVSVRGFGFPHTAQALQVARRVRGLRGRRWPTTIVYAVTSLTYQAASPARLADLRRGHWSIENGLHLVRDVTMGEDACKVRTGIAPQVVACLRNVAVGILRLRGDGNIAAALRHNARDATRPWSCSASQAREPATPRACRGLGRTAARPFTSPAAPSAHRPHHRHAWSMSAACWACWSKMWTMLPEGSANDANRPSGISMTSPTHLTSGCCLVKAATSSTWKYAPEVHCSLSSGRASSMSCTGEPGSLNATVDSPCRQASSSPSSSR
jgi:hypothetical protein